MSKVPPGVEDYDAECANDPFSVAEYAMDIFEYLKSREVGFFYFLHCGIFLSFILTKFKCFRRSSRLMTTWTNKLT